MKVLIVDDEPLARARLQRLLGPIAGFSCVGEAHNSQQAMKMCQQLQPDVLLLDIAMPGGDGLQLAATLTSQPVPPAIIFVTAHPQHALDAYQVCPADYILKPVSAERLAAALARLGNRTRAHIERQAVTDEAISYQLGSTTRQVALSKVQYFIADSKYVRMVFEDGEALLELTLNQLQQRFPEQLVRVHRSTLINKHYFSALRAAADGKHYVELTNQEIRLEVSRRALSQVKQALKLHRN
ncbi:MULTISPECIES: LytR/AlgR family response regulator transcription factor [unclassified Arsukibacterium]|uniref:LytR/AlgR family response regulator transcription factor n=1 Tax=unclassified Arsukibacterium TaxID=2635278 RepID=UPI000C5A4E14|nr:MULTISPECIES: LytTR family DNA-binding domain-containing protein [unclassified Arsukibacterium]MAA93868.1 DNA-binding response regulator [Rheinheimera sp.]MBM34422.1 DNA-binding response regulator [Rheinheimera sp.]HAW93938.1 DNA-binding response regulator [Candidatus Azambacteria bacterium]|tara:strand:+ start:28886 stop:29608 length:723 start_codon:yes stop_codon:yes gene_type:complete